MNRIIDAGLLTLGVLVGAYLSAEGMLASAELGGRYGGSGYGIGLVLAATGLAIVALCGRELRRLIGPRA